MKLKLIDSLLIDVANLIPFVNESDDLIKLELFINLLVKYKKEILNDNEIGIEGVI